MNRSQERAKTRSKRTPRGAARAKRRGARVFKKPAVITESVCDSTPTAFDAIAEMPGCPEHGVPHCAPCVAELVLP